VIAALVLGIIAGAISFLPLLAAVKAARHITATSNLSHASALILALVGSSIVLFGSAAACIALSRDNALTFALGEALGLCVSALGFGIWRAVSMRKQESQKQVEEGKEGN